MQIPSSKAVKIHFLSSAFQDRTTSYKFFWMIAILENVKEQKKGIALSDLAIRMIVNAWFPVHFYHLSFGRTDKLAEVVNAVKVRFGFAENMKTTELYARLKQAYFDKQLPEVNQLLKYVPYRFLTPWFSKDLNKKADWEKNRLIVELSNVQKSIYRIDMQQQCVFIDSDWYEYLFEHIAIVEGFTKWNLVGYLQQQNPNVPGVSEKLVFPESRKMANAYEFWINYKYSHGSFPCLYTGKEMLEKSEVSIDHYLPWSFVAHDQLWNLVPTTKEINSSKGNLLPPSGYFEGFVQLQFDAIRASLHREKLLEGHLLLLNTDIEQLKTISFERFIKEMRVRFDPMFQLARNMGFREWNR